MKPNLSISTKSEETLDRYVNVVKHFGADEANLKRRRAFLIMLLRELEKIPHDGQVYGALLEDKLGLFSQPELKHFYQTIAREFYWFWSNDTIRIQQIERGEGLTLNPFCITIGKSLADQHMDAQTYYMNHPNAALNDYHQHLVKNNIRDLGIRIQWAQTLMYTFKDFDQDSDIYRSAVDAVLNVIDNKTMRQSFLVVVRDFHKFWKTYAQ
jgi:hypothetical protein